MKLFTSKVVPIATELVRALNEAGDIELDSVPEAEIDVQSVLKEYTRVDCELTDKAKDLVVTLPAQSSFIGLYREDPGRTDRAPEAIPLPVPSTSGGRYPGPTTPASPPTGLSFL